MGRKTPALGPIHILTNAGQSPTCPDSGHSHWSIKWVAAMGVRRRLFTRRDRREGDLLPVILLKENENRPLHHYFRLFGRREINAA